MKHIVMNMNVLEMFERHQKLVGSWDKVVWYDIVNNNCQTFVTNHLKANGKYNSERAKFIEQDSETLLQEFPKTVAFVNRAVAFGAIMEDVYEKWRNRNI